MWQKFKKYGWLCLRGGFVFFGLLAIIGFVKDTVNMTDRAQSAAGAAWNRAASAEETAKLPALDVEAVRNRLTRLQATVDKQGADLRTLRLRIDSLNKRNADLEKAVGWLAELSIALADGSAELDSILMEEPPHEESAIKMPAARPTQTYIPLGGTTLEDVYKARQRAIAAGR